MISQVSLTCILLIILISPSHAQPGCTDPLATNYNATATLNDGSCNYPISSITPTTTLPLDASLSETSGLIKWNNSLWTHNDNSDINLYALDTSTGSIIQTYPLTGSVNQDWEEISQDSNYVYVGDFGNNVNGNRTDLHILRIEKNSLLAQTPVIDTIFFSYSDQTDFTPTGSNNTDFDCEAFIVSTDSIYLFSKQWVSNQTSLYTLPKIPGTHVAQLKSTFDVQGLITGATYLQNERLIALCGYTNLLQPFSWLLYDFTGTDFFGGNKRNVSIPLPFHQVEGITTSEGITFYMTNENFTIVSTPQKLHIFDFSSYLSDYLNSLTLDMHIEDGKSELNIFPNPSSGQFTLEFERMIEDGQINVTNILGETVLEVPVNHELQKQLRLENGVPGIYFLTVIKDDIRYVKKIIVN